MGEFYIWLKKIKKDKKLNFSDLGAIIGMSSDAFRMAVKRESLSVLEKSEIKKQLENEQETNNSTLIDENRFILTKNNEELEIDKIVDLIFLYKDKFEANEKFKTYLSDKESKAITEYQKELIKDLNKKRS